MEKQSKCTQTHEIYCSVLYYKFRNDHIAFKLKKDDGTIINLWYSCDNIQQYQIICHDLQQSYYWKVYYVCDTKRIMRMEQKSWSWGCLLQ